MFDLVIVNAKVYDGTGNPYFYANVGVSGSKIAKISHLPLEGKEVIDGKGLALCPGFIDAHGHIATISTQRA